MSEPVEIEMHYRGPALRLCDAWMLGYGDSEVGDDLPGLAVTVIAPPAPRETCTSCGVFRGMEHSLDCRKPSPNVLGLLNSDDLHLPLPAPPSTCPGCGFRVFAGRNAPHDALCPYVVVQQVRAVPQLEPVFCPECQVNAEMLEHQKGCSRA